MQTTSLETDILILGAGIGGYETFRTLAKELKRAGLEQKITIVDYNNYYTFTPMLHEVASGSIEPTHCTVPLRELVYRTPHRFLKARVKKIQPAEKCVTTDVGTIRYTKLVVALGSGVNYFNTPGAAEFSYSVRTLDAAIRLRHELIAAFEKTGGSIAITIVGGGYTGIETATQLHHLVTHDLKKLYPGRETTITIVEAGPTILGNLPLVVQTKIKERLVRQGIPCLLGHAVQTVGKDMLTFKDGTTLPSTFTVWCAGVKNQADLYLEAPYQEGGRIPTNEFLLSHTDDSLYVAGDMSRFCNPGSTQPVPQLGETAHNQGYYVGRHLALALQGKTIKPYTFKSHGSLIPVGEWYGVVIIGKFILFGRLAWWMRRTAYLLFIPGLLRKLKIVIDWTLHALSFRYIIDIESKK